MTLSEYLATLARRRWQPGTLDCGVFMADWLVACGHPDPIADVRGSYDSERGFLRILRREGGFERPPARGAWRGSVRRDRLSTRREISRWCCRPMRSERPVMRVRWAPSCVSAPGARDHVRSRASSSRSGARELAACESRGPSPAQLELPRPRFFGESAKTECVRRRLEGRRRMAETVGALILMTFSIAGAARRRRRPRRSRSPAPAVTFSTVVGTAAIIGASIGLQYALAAHPDVPKPENGSQPIKQAIPPRIMGYGTNRLAGYYMLFEIGPNTVANSFDVMAFHSGRIGAIRGLFLHDDAITVERRSHPWRARKRAAAGWQRQIW
jgi:hypothetical protein